MAEVSARAFTYRNKWLRDDGGFAAAPEKLVAGEIIERLTAGIREDRHTPGDSAGGPTNAPPANPSGTGFIVVDREGSAVACTLTLNNLFGVGRSAPGMGILLAALPGPRGRGPDSLAPMLLINNFYNIFFFGAAASGGPVAPSALAGVAVGAIMGRTGETLEGALNARRVHNSGDPDVTYYEQDLSPGVLEALSKRGHRLTPVGAMGSVNAILCPGGVPTDATPFCENRTDPRGFGLASGAE